jgi:hypothetical protein
MERRKPNKTTFINNIIFVDKRTFAVIQTNRQGREKEDFYLIDRSRDYDSAHGRIFIVNI